MRVIPIPTDESMRRQGFQRVRPQVFLNDQMAHAYMDEDKTKAVVIELVLNRSMYTISEPHEVTITTKHQRQQRERKRK